MKYQDYLLLKLSEECAEVIKEANKAFLFGLGTNSERIRKEVRDILAVLQELQGTGWNSYISEEDVSEKVSKLRHYYKGMIK